MILRVRALENLFKIENKSTKAVHVSTLKKKISCPCCKSNNSLYKCLKADGHQITIGICSQKHYLQCLSSGHDVKKCTYKEICYKCKDIHNSLLHKDFIPSIRQVTSGNVLFINNLKFRTLLSTASITVVDSYDKPNAVRSLLESGSQVNYIIITLCTHDFHK